MPSIIFRWCFVWIIKISQYIKINISEGVDLNKTSAWKECEVLHYWFFKNIGFKSEEPVCNGCHYVLTAGYSLENIANLSAKCATYRCILMGISKNGALKQLNNSVTRDRGVL